MTQEGVGGAKQHMIFTNHEIFSWAQRTKVAILEIWILSNVFKSHIC